MISSANLNSCVMGMYKNTSVTIEAGMHCMSGLVMRRDYILYICFPFAGNNDGLSACSELLI